MEHWDNGSKWEKSVRTGGRGCTRSRAGNVPEPGCAVLQPHQDPLEAHWGLTGKRGAELRPEQEKMGSKLGPDGIHEAWPLPALTAPRLGGGFPFQLCGLAQGGEAPPDACVPTGCASVSPSAALPCGELGGVGGGDHQHRCCHHCRHPGGDHGVGGGTQPWTPGSSASPPATPRKTLRCCNALGGAPMGTSSR